MKLLAIAHYASKYLHITQPWIYQILINQKLFRPIFLTRITMYLDSFPLDGVYSLSDFGRVRFASESFFHWLFGYFKFYETICRKENIQILHAHFGYHGVKMLGLKRKLNVPMVCSFYGDDAFAKLHTDRNKKKYLGLFSEAEKILALGPYMKSELIKLGCPAEKITIHHLGINVNEIEFKQRSISKGEKIKFLIVAGFVQKKGIDIAIKALSAFRDRYDFSLDIIGDGPLKNEILAVIEDSGIKDKIKLHGYQPYRYFIDMAYQCDVFIQASRTGDGNQKEGTPMAIVDAMATGMAVVSTKHSDIPEIVKDGEHGYLAEENSVSSLIDCLQKIFNSPEKIEAFSTKARHWVEKEFNAEIQTGKLEEYYDAIIADKAILVR
jgi:colanic acid/amylovoran biosynthesis glycosyltransferase